MLGFSATRWELQTGKALTFSNMEKRVRYHNSGLTKSARIEALGGLLMARSFPVEPRRCPGNGKPRVGRAAEPSSQRGTDAGVALKGWEVRGSLAKVCAAS